MALVSPKRRFFSYHLYLLFNSCISKSFLIRKLKYIFENPQHALYYNVLTFVTAVCVMFLIKLRWRWKKNIYDVNVVYKGTKTALKPFNKRDWAWTVSSRGQLVPDLDLNPVRNKNTVLELGASFATLCKSIIFFWILHLNYE